MLCWCSVMVTRWFPSPQIGVRFFAPSPLSATQAKRQRRPVATQNIWRSIHQRCSSFYGGYSVVVCTSNCGFEGEGSFPSGRPKFSSHVKMMIFLHEKFIKWRNCFRNSITKLMSFCMVTKPYLILSSRVRKPLISIT